MREIKFRAWDKVTRQFVTSFTMTSNGHIELWVGDGSGKVREPQDFDALQYTGLKDKNGVEIYEGDMVEYKAYNIWHRDEVKFTDGKFHGNLNGVKEELQSRYDLGLIVTLGCEVIGNIYENPKLLESKEER